ncbi:DNA-binding domain-containing protein [Roseovarius amoyensis]|uniref:HvfC/BufC N-terminal domain-containing protein n=1 Tax=Roseovarius amoyensis TaxID=2211448 RepID=UPI000DBEA046|nr:DNA-binding domain-containing protein [Roseovarius amoyensis]
MSVDQSGFHDALLDAERPVPKGLTDGHGRPAGKRFDIYRNNVAVSLTEALELSFPCVRRLIGEENFKRVAGVFLRRHPPRTPMLMQYGADFPTFLEGFEPLSHLGYLPDVARLEQALRLSYHAADAAPADAEQLARIPPEALADTRMELAPAVRLVRSNWPVHAIWAFNMEDGPKPQPDAQDVLITRPALDPLMTVTGAGTAEFVAALINGETLGTAHQRTTGAAADFDLAPALSLLLGGSAISKIQPAGDISCNA